MSCFASLTLSDHGGYFWKTSQQSFIEEQMTFSDTWPRSACVTTTHTSDGWKVTASAQPTLARLTDVIGGSALPTPNTLDHTGSGRMNTNANVKKWGGINSLGGMADWTLADTQCCGYTGSGSSGNGVYEQTNKRREAIIALPMRQYGVWAFEPEVCRVVDGPAARIHRAKRLKALGNAVVPQAAHYIGHNIVSYINDCSKET